MTNKCLSLVIHGGAGAMAGRDYAAELAHMRGLIEAGRDRLSAGASAMDVAVETVAALEASGLYVAGRGASANSAGKFELDASLMDGPDPARRRGGGAAGLRLADPRRAGGDGARRRTCCWPARARRRSRRRRGWSASGQTGSRRRARRNAPRLGLATGTVGCVALDETGALAAATSTGGTNGKLAGPRRRQPDRRRRRLGRRAGSRSPAPASANTSCAPPPRPRSPSACSLAGQGLAAAADAALAGRRGARRLGRPDRAQPPPARSPCRSAARA